MLGSRLPDFGLCHFPQLDLSSLVLSPGPPFWSLRDNDTRRVDACRPGIAECRRSSGPSAPCIHRMPCSLAVSQVERVPPTMVTGDHQRPAPASQPARMSRQMIDGHSCHRHLLGHHSEPTSVVWWSAYPPLSVDIESYRGCGHSPFGIDIACKSPLS